MLKPGFVADNSTRWPSSPRAPGAARRSSASSTRTATSTTPPPCAPNGEIVGTYRKRLLPNYAVFDEARYFTPGDETDPLELYVIGGVKVGIWICEDIWSPVGPLSDAGGGRRRAEHQHQRLAVPPGKGAGRERMLATRAADAHCALVYVNQVGGQDELVFDGGVAGVRRRGQAARPRPAVRRGAADRRRADPAGVPQAPARPAGPGHQGAAADRRRCRRRRSCRREPVAGTDRRAVRRRRRAVRRAGARHPRLLPQERLHRRRDRAVGRHRLDDRRLHRRRRARRRPRARRVDAVALLQRPLEVRRRAARRRTSASTTARSRSSRRSRPTSTCWRRRSRAASRG